jgi:hypothetical protein
MGIFSSSATLELRVAQLESTLAAANNNLATLADDFATAAARVVAAEDLVVTLTAERDAATLAHTAAVAENAVLRQVTDLLGLTAEVVAAFTPDTAPAAFAAALEARVGHRAVELAANQGVPPLATNPSGSVSDSAETIYDRFAAADSASSTRMYQDATLGPVIRNESARRYSGA